MKKKKDKKLRGRKLSAWKIVLVSILALLCVLALAAYAFLELYKPTVDDDGPYISVKDDYGAFSLHYYSPARKPHMVEALGRFRVNALTGVNMKVGDDFSRRDGVYNFLVMGHDHVALNTDVIMIISYDVNNGAISIVQIPRDTYIEYNGYPNKINSTLAYMYTKAYREGRDDLYHAALEETATLLEKTMNIQIDNYALINLKAFSNIVNIIGGVALDVPADMDYDDPYQDLHIHIKKGYQVLDGKTAADFIRFRSGYIQADLGRQDAQKLFMSALIKQLKESMTVDKIAKLAEQVLNNITTDMTLSDIVYYAKSALSVDLENISMMTVPGYAINTFGGSYYVIYRKNTLEMINKYFNVYKSDITDELFDQQNWFTNENSEEINSIYLSDDGKINVSNSGSISQDGIYIPRVYYIPTPETSKTDTSAETGEDISESDSTETSEGNESDIFEAQSSDELGTESDTDVITEQAVTETDTEEDTYTTEENTSEAELDTSEIEE